MIINSSPAEIKSKIDRHRFTVHTICLILSIAAKDHNIQSKNFFDLSAFTLYLIKYNQNPFNTRNTHSLSIILQFSFSTLLNQTMNYKFLSAVPFQKEFFFLSMKGRKFLEMNNKRFSNKIFYSNKQEHWGARIN